MSVINITKKIEIDNYDDKDNLVPLLDTGDADSIASAVAEMFLQDESDCKNRHDKIKAYLGIFDNDPDYFRQARITNGSQLHYTLIQEAVYEFVTTFINEFPLDKPVIAKNADDVPSQEDMAVNLVMQGQLQPESPKEEAQQKVKDSLRDIKIGRHKNLMDAEDAVTLLNYQFLHDMPDWQEDTQELAKLLCLQGSVIRKYSFCPIEKRPIHKLVNSHKFFVNKDAKSIDGAKRLSECEAYNYANIKPLIESDYFVALKEDDKNLSEDNDIDFSIIEMSLRIDLDGDGYPEPYVAWVHKEGSQLMRLEKNFDTVIRNDKGRAIVIKARHRYCRYAFLPSGDFWGRGFGDILSMPQDTLSSILNLMIDTGTKSALGGGFYLSNTGNKERAINFKAGEWKPFRSNAGTGQSVRDMFMPIPNPEPSQTLFSVMQLLDGKANSLANLNSMNSEQFGANTAPTTAMIMAEESTKKLRAVLKRFFLQFNAEIDALVECNKRYLNVERYSELLGIQVRQEFFEKKDVKYVVNKDIDSIGNARQMALVQFFESKTQDPMYNPKRVRKEVLRLMGVDDPDYFLIDPPKPEASSPDPVMMGQLEIAKSQIEVQKITAENKNEIDTLKLLLDDENKKDKLDLERVKVVSEVENKQLQAQAQAIDMRNQPIGAINGGIDGNQTGQAQVEQGGISGIPVNDGGAIPAEIFRPEMRGNPADGDTDVMPQ